MSASIPSSQSGFDIELVDKKGHTCAGWRTSDPIVPADGYGGHPVGARPKRKALTVWQGRQPFTMTVPMLFFRGGLSVEQDREELESMAIGEEHVTATHQDSVTVKVGPNIILPVPPSVSNNWWIEDITWGEEIRSGALGGALTRKNLTVKLLERVDDVTVKPEPKPPKVSFGENYRVVKGDTLHKIALRRLGDANRWEEIKDLNPKIHSDKDLHPGKTILKLPGTFATLISVKNQPTSASE